MTKITWVEQTCCAVCGDPFGKVVLHSPMSFPFVCGKRKCMEVARFECIKDGIGIVGLHELSEEASYLLIGDKIDSFRKVGEDEIL